MELTFMKTEEHTGLFVCYTAAVRTYNVVDKVNILMYLWKEEFYTNKIMQKHKKVFPTNSLYTGRPPRYSNSRQNIFSKQF